MAPTPPAAPGVSEVAATSGAHRRIALCIGIDNYPTAQLFGCRNDAELWQSGGRRPQAAVPNAAVTSAADPPSVGN